MIKKSRVITALGVAVALGAIAPSGMATAADTTGISEASFVKKVQAYAIAHPGDIEGFEALVEELGGTSDSDSQTLYQSDIPGSVQARGNFPSDVFTVSIVRGSVGTAKVVTGSVNWRDNFAGQSAPLDFAALRFSSGCGTMSQHQAATYNLRGAKTNRATLRSAGVGTNAPIWNVNATTTAFENQADRTSVTVVYETKNCGSTKVQAAFDYEGNQGGSVVSVGAGWGGLSVGYNNVGLELTKSTGAITLN